MQDEVKVTQADVVRALDRAIEQIMGIEIEAMNGDNLAVTLCSHFDDPDGGELDDNGWSQAATDAYDEIKAEIAGKFVPVREAIAAFARHRQQAERGEVVVDSGFSAENLSVAEWLWTNLPTGNRKWHSLPTHEKALVCHMVERLREPLYSLPTPPEAV